MITKISHLIEHRQKLSAAQIANLVATAAIAPFTPDLLPADERLWGSFWHFDVIGPGYTLPALELALLRAIRLDKQWPSNCTPAQYLADLHAAVMYPHAGIRTLVVADAPCAVFAAAHDSVWFTVVWFCLSTGCLHAGYRLPSQPLHSKGMVEQRTPQFSRQDSPPHGYTPEWLASATAPITVARSLTSQLDAAILRRRQLDM